MSFKTLLLIGILVNAITLTVAAFTHNTNAALWAGAASVCFGAAYIIDLETRLEKIKSRLDSQERDL